PASRRRCAGRSAPSLDLDPTSSVRRRAHVATYRPQPHLSHPERVRCHPAWTHFWRKHMKRILLFSLILAAAACGGGAQLSLSARAGTTASTQSAAGATQQALTVNSGITVDRLRIVVREVELERASAQPDDTRDAQEFEAGPFVIDLGAGALSGTGA